MMTVPVGIGMMLIALAPSDGSTTRRATPSLGRRSEVFPIARALAPVLAVAQNGSGREP